MYTKNELMTSFNELMSCSYKGVPGIRVVDSGNLGPVVGFTIFTHGNEPSGIAAYRYLQESRVMQKIKSGKLICCINNLEAAKKFFDAVDADNEKKCRFLEINMNRLPEQSGSWLGDKRYETQRAWSLLPIWKEFEAALDVHSTSQDSPPMLVMGDNVPPDHYRDFPISIMITNIHHVQIGLPAYAFYGDSGGTPVFEIEAGQHTKEESFHRAARCIELYLQNLGLIEPEKKLLSEPKKQELQVFEISGSVIAPDRSYVLVEVLKNFNFVSGGTVLANGSGDPLIMPWDGHVIFGPPEKKIAYQGEEVYFLSKPVKVVSF
ncbi:MAG: succinylglutamate desuccinylase/aspartoacylase family protein [Candidatus Paceibacteria bacterium]